MIPGSCSRRCGAGWCTAWSRRSGFRAVPVQFRGSADEARTWRVLLVWRQSVAPNSLALGVDQDRNIMITHQLVRPEADAVSSFVIAAAAMAVALVPCLVVLMRGTRWRRSSRIEAISSVTIMVLILLAEGFRRTGEFELPVLGAVLLLGSGLVFVRFLERGL